ncbi:MAG: protein kinase, partial [Acidobacteriota bacterium]
MSEPTPPETLRGNFPERIGPYRLEGRLGKGGMGEVYRGYDERLGRPVAMKRVLASNASNDRIRERFRREARTVARLNHPSIVQVFDWVEQDDENWLVMELIEGVPLNEVVHLGDLSMRQLVACSLGIAEGLEAAHRAGIIHRDLKLSNVMLTEDGVKILDFGIAKVTRSPDGDPLVTLTQSGAVMGSLSAMSPEQALGQKVDHRSDLFSLGSLLYELLTGTAPFRGRNTSETLIRIYSWEHLPIEDRNAEVPSRFCRLVDRLLEKEPENRPLDASAVVQVLEDVAADLGGRSSRMFKAHTELADDVAADEAMEATLPEGLATRRTDELTEVVSPAPAPSTAMPSQGDSASLEPAPSQASASSPPSPNRRAAGAGQSPQATSPVPAKLAYFLATAALVAAAVWWFRTPSTPPQPAGEATSTEAATAAGAGQIRTDRIAVLPFENRTGDPAFDSLGLIIADWLTQGLSRSGTLEVVATDLAARSVRYATQEGGGALELDVVADDTRAGTLVSGAYYASGDELIVRGQITDTVEDRVISPLEPLRMPRKEPVGRLGILEEATRAKVAAAFDQQLATLGQLANAPPTYEAYEAYVQGMERFWRLDFPGAIERFDRAAEIAPSFAMPQLMAATAHLNLGRFDAARPIIAAVEAQREGLATLDRLFLDWLSAESRGDYAAAAEIAGLAAHRAPLSGWKQTLGVDSLRANRPEAAVEALASLDPERGYLRGWVPHFEYLTLAYHLAGDVEGELAAARRGLALYPDSLIVATAEARALVSAGEVEGLGSRLERFADLESEFLHTPGLSRSLVAYELASHGFRAEAGSAGELAIDWYRSQSGPAAREGEALMLLFLDRATEAVPIYRE